MTIRAAQASDAQQIAQLWNGMIRDTFSTFTTIEKTPSDIMGMITARRNAFLVAFHEEQFAGFVTYGPFRSGPGYGATVEHTLLVAAQYQGLGMGGKLLEAAQIQARDQGHHVMVAAISHTNVAAQKFHHGLGYGEVGRMAQVGFKRGEWLDLVLMQKIL